MEGFLLAGFAAAYMSTIATHLNWGASYLVNDVLHRRFLETDERKALRPRRGRLTTVFLFLASIVVTLNLGTIEGVALPPRALRERHRPRPDPPVVLVADQRLERDLGHGRLRRRLPPPWRGSHAPGAIAPGPGADFGAQAKTMLVTVVVSTIVWSPSRT